MRLRPCMWAVAATVALSGLTVHAQNTGGQPDWLDLAKVIAVKEGISVGEAVRRVRLSQKINRLDEKFAADPDYAGAWIEQDSRNFRVKFAFKGGKRGNLNDAEVEAESEFVAAPRSLDELKSAQADVARQLKAHGIKAAFSSVVEEQRINLWPSDAAKLKELISSGAVTIPDFFNIKDQYVLPRPEYDVLGSGGMTVKEGTRTYNCTGGFVVTNNKTDASGKQIRGISTAGHCSIPGKNYVTHHRGVAVGAVQPEMAVFESGVGVDASWYREPTYNYTNQVRVSSTKTYSITVSGPQTPTKGTSICILKRDEPEQCSKVYAHWTWPEGGGPYVALEDGITDGGDSGAPWLIGGWAYGIHQGTVPEPVGTTTMYRSLYTPTANLPRIGLQVVWQP